MSVVDFRCTAGVAVIACEELLPLVESAVIVGVSLGCVAGMVLDVAGICTAHNIEAALLAFAAVDDVD